MIFFLTLSNNTCTKKQNEEIEIDQTEIVWKTGVYRKIESLLHLFVKYQKLIKFEKNKAWMKKEKEKENKRLSNVMRSGTCHTPRYTGLLSIRRLWQWVIDTDFIPAYRIGFRINLEIVFVRYSKHCIMILNWKE